MKPGQAVTYGGRDGCCRPARIASVGGSGPSLFKRLDLAVDGVLVRDVPHESDATDGEFWATHDSARHGLDTQPRPKPRRLSEFVTSAFPDTPRKAG